MTIEKKLPPRRHRTPFGTIGNRYPAETVDAVNIDADRLGLSQSEWMRMAVDRALKAKVAHAAADPWRKPLTVRQMAAARRAQRQAEGAQA